MSRSGDRLGRAGSPGGGVGVHPPAQQRLGRLPRGGHPDRGPPALETAALIAGSIEAGALLATDDEEVIARYRRFGWALGLAFQLNDDLLGIWGQEQHTGKVPTDIARHKKTLPVLYAFEHATPADRERLTMLSLYC